MIQNAQLSASELLELRKLSELCFVRDGGLPKIYWDLLSQKRERNSNILYYLNDHLVGYLSFFLFHETEAEIFALIHPDYRKQGLFFHLFQTASNTLISLGIKKTICVIPHENEMAKECFESMNGNFINFEYHMERTDSSLESIVNNPLKIKKAGIHDVELMAELDSLCFQSNYLVMLQRFQETIMQPEREVYLAYLDETCIGKAHILLNNQESNIHDVCILPDYQNKGYGGFLLKFLVNYLIQNKNCSKMSLEVTANNESALQLYKKCNFLITNLYEYWAIPIQHS